MAQPLNSIQERKIWAILTMDGDVVETHSTWDDVAICSLYA